MSFKQTQNKQILSIVKKPVTIIVDPTPITPNLEQYMRDLSPNNFNKSQESAMEFEAEHDSFNNLNPLNTGDQNITALMGENSQPTSENSQKSVQITPYNSQDGASNYSRDFKNKKPILPAVKIGSNFFNKDKHQPSGHDQQNLIPLNNFSSQPLNNFSSQYLDQQQVDKEQDVLEMLDSELQGSKTQKHAYKKQQQLLLSRRDKENVNQLNVQQQQSMITDAFSEIRSTLPSINMKRNKNQTEFSTNVSTDKSQYFPTPEPSKLKKLKKSNLKQKTQPVLTKSQQDEKDLAEILDDNSEFNKQVRRDFRVVANQQEQDRYNQQEESKLKEQDVHGAYYNSQKSTPQKRQVAQIVFNPITRQVQRKVVLADENEAQQIEFANATVLQKKIEFEKDMKDRVQYIQKLLKFSQEELTGVRALELRNFAQSTYTWSLQSYASNNVTAAMITFNSAWQFQPGTIDIAMGQIGEILQEWMIRRKSNQMATSYKWSDQVQYIVGVAERGTENADRLLGWHLHFGVFFKKFVPKGSCAGWVKDPVKKVSYSIYQAIMNVVAKQAQEFLPPKNDNIEISSKETHMVCMDYLLKSYYVKEGQNVYKQIFFAFDDTFPWSEVFLDQKISNINVNNMEIEVPRIQNQLVLAQNKSRKLHENFMIRKFKIDSSNLNTNPTVFTDQELDDLEGPECESITTELIAFMEKIPRDIAHAWFKHKNPKLYFEQFGKMSTYLEKNAKEVFVDAEVMFKAFIYTEQEWNEQVFPKMKLTRDSNGLTLEEIIISGINYIPEFFRYCREFLLQSHDVKQKSKGFFYLLSGCSNSGKTAWVKGLLKFLPGIGFSKTNGFQAPVNTFGDTISATNLYYGIKDECSFDNKDSINADTIKTWVSEQHKVINIKYSSCKLYQKSPLFIITNQTMDNLPSLCIDMKPEKGFVAGIQERLYFDETNQLGEDGLARKIFPLSDKTYTATSHLDKVIRMIWSYVYYVVWDKQLIKVQDNYVDILADFI